MNKLIFLLGGTALAIAVYKMMTGPDLAYSDGVERTAGRVGAWGTGQRVSGAGGQIGGKLEQGIGNLTGNRDLADQGVFDEATSTVQNAVGKVGQAVGSTIHDLNK